MKAKKGKTMQKNKKDPVKEFQRQAVEQRVCLFYVADRVKLSSPFALFTIFNWKV